MKACPSPTDGYQVFATHFDFSPNALSQHRKTPKKIWRRVFKNTISWRWLMYWDMFHENPQASPFAASAA